MQSILHISFRVTSWALGQCTMASMLVAWIRVNSLPMIKPLYKRNPLRSSETYMHQDTRSSLVQITHWDRVTHMCVSKLTITDSDNGLAPGRRHAIIWTNAGMLWIWLLGTKFSEILIEIHISSYKKLHNKMPSAKCRPFCLGLNVLMDWQMFSTTQLSEPMMAHCWLDPWELISVIFQSK